MFGFGVPEMLILLLFAGVPLAGAIDAARRSDASFGAAGQNKVLWVLLQLVGVFLCVIGLVLGIVYFVAIRPKVAAADAELQ